jgi:hypothetical protein
MAKKSDFQVWEGGGTYLAAVRRSAAVETPAGRLMSSKNRAAAREAKKEKPILLSLSSVSDLPAAGSNSR